MAAVAQRAPVVREHTVAPAEQGNFGHTKPNPIIHDFYGSVDDACLSTERLIALLRSNNADLHEGIIEAEDLPEYLRERVYSIWLIYLIAVERVQDMDRLFVAMAGARLPLAGASAA